MARQCRGLLITCISNSSRQKGRRVWKSFRTRYFGRIFRIEKTKLPAYGLGLQVHDVGRRATSFRDFCTVGRSREALVVACRAQEAQRAAYRRGGWTILPRTSG